MFGSENNYQQLKTKHGEGSHITVGQGCRQEHGDIIIPYYRKLTLHEIKVLEINAT